MVLKFFFRVRQMVWLETHDVLLCREIPNIRPWKHRAGSPERKLCWDEISTILNSIDEPYFKLTPKSVRNRYSLIAKKFKSKQNEENKASGISPEITELNEALQDITERFNEADLDRDKESAEKKSKQAEDLIKAQEIRNQSLETFGDTRKRKEDTGEVNRKRSRKTDTFLYLEEKSKRDHELQAEAIKLKEKKLELQAQQLQMQHEAQFAQTLLIQQQNAAMIEMLKMINGKK